MSNLCVIPARGGSKRIPRKNIKNFCGKPIIAYSIEAALQSNCFDKVIVSTDDQEIADIAIQYGAEVPFFRSIEASNDYATLSDVVEEVKREYAKECRFFDFISLILPTAPFITTTYLKKSYEILKDKDIDSVRPVVRFSYPIQRAYRKNSNGLIEMMNANFLNARSQDLESAFHDAGMFYTMRWSKGLMGQNKYAFEVSSMQTHDIDSLEDWDVAEFKFKYLKK